MLWAHSETYLSCSPLLACRLQKENKKNVLLVQWQPLSICRPIHSKHNGKCLSNETESVFITQNQAQPAELFGGIGQERKGKWWNVYKAFLMLHKIPSYYHLSAFSFVQLSALSSSLRYSLLHDFYLFIFFSFLIKGVYNISTFIPLVTKPMFDFCAVFGFGPLISYCQRIQYKAISHSACSLRERRSISLVHV